MKKYSTVVIGAGYAGIGYAMCNRDVLVLEKDEMPGSDFHSVLRPAGGRISSSAPESKDFERFLQANGVIKNDRIDILNCCPAICRYLLDKTINFNLLFDAQLIYVKKVKDGYEVEYRTNEGIHTVTAEKIIDTTFAFDSAPQNIKVNRKLLHVLLSYAPEELLNKLLKENNHISLDKGFYENECFLSFGFAVDVSLFEARQAVEHCLTKAFGGKHQVIDAIGFDFDIEAFQVMQNDILWMPPHNFLNPVQAFDYGCNTESKL